MSMCRTIALILSASVWSTVALAQSTLAPPLLPKLQYYDRWIKWSQVALNDAKEEKLGFIEFDAAHKIKNEQYLTGTGGAVHKVWAMRANEKPVAGYCSSGLKENHYVALDSDLKCDPLGGDKWFGQENATLYRPKVSAACRPFDGGKVKIFYGVAGHPAVTLAKPLEWYGGQICNGQLVSPDTVAILYSISSIEGQVKGAITNLENNLQAKVAAVETKFANDFPKLFSAGDKKALQEYLKTELSKVIVDQLKVSGKVP